MNLRVIKKFDEEILCYIVRRIVRAVDPEKIVLFSSYAYGKPKRDSDIDILVIMPSKLPRYECPIRIYEALDGLVLAIDVIVYTPDEAEEWSDVPQAFITSILKKGKVIYEKKKR